MSFRDQKDDSIGAPDQIQKGRLGTTPEAGRSDALFRVSG
jgi:hypothetical protein